MTEAPAKPRKKTISRLVYGGFIALTSVFVVQSTLQIARGVFQAPEDAKAVGAACGTKLGAMIAGVDRALEAAATATDGDEAKQKYVDRRRAAWAGHEDVERTCSNDPHGKEALAAIARYDRAAEAFAARKGTELSPVRRRAQSFIRQDLR